MSENIDGEDRTTPGPAVSDGVQEQLTRGDMLSDSPFDPLDEGWSPPDREPRIQVPTEAEEAAGLSLDQLLAAEEPDVDAALDPGDPLSEEPGGQVGDRRSGRLRGADLGDWSHDDGDLVAADVGIDGAAASAEEAAVHVIEDPDRDDLDDLDDSGVDDDDARDPF